MASPELPDRRVHPRRYDAPGPSGRGLPAPPPRRAPVPPSGRHGPGADERPTDVLHGLVPDDPGPDAPVEDAPDGSDGPPGRRRRQLGASPDERPASSYRAPATSGRGPRQGRRRRPSFWRELPILVVVALALTFLIQTFLAKVYVIPSGSMETTLHGCTGCVNDRVLVDKVTYRFGTPQPGDVVVFRGPDTWRNQEFVVDEPASPAVRALQGLGSLIGLAPPDEKDFVKRVIAVGGQTVACCDPRNRVLVDGEPLDEPYVYYLPDAGPARQIPFGPVTVPTGELWMMGDSRNNSADSRVPGHGAVPVENVIGVARLVVLPVDRFQSIPAVDPRESATAQAATAPPPGSAGGPLAFGLLGVLPGALRGGKRLPGVL